jgi:DNA invertase Pin-like site-specific DNA recombinase
MTTRGETAKKQQEEAGSLGRKKSKGEEFNTLGVEFVSLSENIDTSTPAGKMIFTVLGAVAELERGLTVERVKAGLRNARAKGKRLGRPHVFVSESRIDALRAAGASWRAIAKELGVAVGTVHRVAQERSKIPCRDIERDTDARNDCAAAVS